MGLPLIVRARHVVHRLLHDRPRLPHQLIEAARTGGPGARGAIRVAERPLSGLTDAAFDGDAEAIHAAVEGLTAEAELRGGSGYDA